MANRKPLSSDIIYGMPGGGGGLGQQNCCAFSRQPLAAHAILIMRNSQTCTRRHDVACPVGRGAGAGATT